MWEKAIWPYVEEGKKKYRGNKISCMSCAHTNFEKGDRKKGVILSDWYTRGSNTGTKRNYTARIAQDGQCLYFCYTKNWSLHQLFSLMVTGRYLFPGAGLLFTDDMLLIPQACLFPFPMVS